MSKWDEFCDAMSRTANKAAVKAGELGETAKLKYKLHQAKGMLTEAYEKLGRLTYDQISYNHDHTAEVNDLMARITRLREKIARLSAAAAKEDNAVYCTNCGTRLEREMIYCPGCGEKQGKTTSANTDSQTSPSHTGDTQN